MPRNYGATKIPLFNYREISFEYCGRFQVFNQANMQDEQSFITILGYHAVTHWVSDGDDQCLIIIYADNI